MSDERSELACRLRSEDEMKQVTKENVFNAEGPVVNRNGTYSTEPTLEVLVQNWFKNTSIYDEQKVAELTEQYISKWVEQNG